jgi:HAMP domain-containing protein
VDTQLRAFGSLTSHVLAHPPRAVTGTQLPTDFLVEIIDAVMVHALPGGRRAVIAISLDDLQGTVAQLEVADAVAGAAALGLLAAIGLPLVRASLTPLSRIEDTAEAIAAGDLSRRITHPRSRPRWAGWPPRSTSCSAVSRPPTGRGKKARRTRLGLSIAAALVAAHHGTITVVTRPGHGAAFRVRLPLAAGDDAAAAGQ